MGIAVSRDRFNRSHEPVAATGKRFDEARIVGCVPEGLAKTVHSGVDAVLIVNEGSIGPERAGDFFAGQQFPFAVQEQAEDLKRLRAEPDTDSLPAKLSSDHIRFIDSEAIEPDWLGFRHACSRVYPMVGRGPCEHASDPFPEVPQKQ